MRGREAQVRLLPRARPPLSLGERTQGQTPRRARKSCLWRALLSHIPCDVAQPRARETGPCPAGSPSELPGRPRPHGNGAASLRAGAERPVRVCPHLAAQVRQADTGPRRCRLTCEGLSREQEAHRAAAERVTLSGRSLLHLFSGPSRARSAQRQGPATAAKRHRTPHPSHSKLQSCRTRLSRCQHSSPNVHQMRCGSGHRGSKGGGSWVTSLKPGDDQNRKLNFQG